MRQASREKQTMNIKIFSTKIYISVLFVAVITFMLILDKTGLAPYCLLSVAIHELSHLIAMKLENCAPREIRLTPASVGIIREFKCSISAEKKIAFAGPFGNIITGIIFIVLFLIFKKTAILQFALLNFVTAVFNLLPVLELDGGTILICILVSNKVPREKAERILRLITLAVSLLAIFFATLLALNKTYNPSAFIIGIYLFICALLRY